MISKTTYQLLATHHHTIQPRQIVIIDPQIDDRHILAAAVLPGVELLILNPDRDGIEQITKYLTCLPAGETGGRGDWGTVPCPPAPLHPLRQAQDAACTPASSPPPSTSSPTGQEDASASAAAPQNSTTLPADIQNAAPTILEAAGGGENATATSIGMAELSEMTREQILEFIQENPDASANVNNLVTQIISGSSSSETIIDNIIPGEGLVSASTIAAINDIVTFDLGGINDIATAEPVTVPSVSRSDVAVAIDSGNMSEATVALDMMFSEELGNYIQKPVPANIKSFGDIQRRLGGGYNYTRSQTAIIYLFLRPEQLDIILVPPKGLPIHQSVPEAKRQVLLETIQKLNGEITNPRQRNSSSYLAASQQLYRWLIAPIEDDINNLGLDTILFSMDAGLRSLPIAALHDGQQFLVEKYSLALIPSVNLTDTNYLPLKDAEILAMGASQFQGQTPLPAVPVEITNITQNWQVSSFLNENFTLDNLKKQRVSSQFRICPLSLVPYHLSLIACMRNCQI